MTNASKKFMLCLVVNKVLKRRQGFLSYSELGCQESPSSLTRSQLICRKVDTRRALIFHAYAGRDICPWALSVPRTKQFSESAQGSRNTVSCYKRSDREKRYKTFLWSCLQGDVNYGAGRSLQQLDSLRLLYSKNSFVYYNLL